MDFGLRSKKNRGQIIGDLGWCDITSMMVKRRGHDRYDFGLTLQGCVVRPPEATSSSSTSRKSAQPIDLPISSRIEIDQDALFKQMSGLRDIFSSAVLPAGLDYGSTNVELPKLDDQSSSLCRDAVPNTSFDPQAVIYSDTFGEVGSIEDGGEQAWGSLSCDTVVDEYGRTMENDFSAELFGLEIALDNPFAETSFESQDSSLNLSSSTEEDQRLVLSAPGTPSAFSSTINGRHYCRLCNTAFKRPGDVKRHSKVHFPERNFHCREPDCKRNGKHGFYRKDKLRAHQRQVHNM
jgi:hypothetical protein